MRTTLEQYKLNTPTPATSTGTVIRQGQAFHLTADLWSALGGLLLVAALAFAIIWSASNPSVAGREATRTAAALLREGRYSQAVALLERTLLDYDSPQLRIWLSYGYLARRDAERAGRQAQIAISKSPPHLLPEAWSQLGRVLAFEGNHDRALEAWSQAIAHAQPLTANKAVEAHLRSALWHSAMTFWRRGDWDPSRRMLERLLEKRDLYGDSARLKLAQLVAPDDQARSLQLLAELEAGWQSHSQDGAQWLAGSAVPDLRVPGLREGMPLQALRRDAQTLRRALEQASQAQRAGGDEATIAIIWGNAYLQQDEARLAKRYLERAVALNPRSAEAHTGLGIALMQLGDADRAISHLQTAARLDRSQPLPHHALVEVYIQRKQWASAAHELGVLSDLQPASVIVRMQRAEYYVQTGYYADAENEYIGAVNLQRGGAPDAGKVDAMLALARFYTDVRGMGCEKGLSPAQESLARNPDDPASLDAVGWSLVLCNRPAEALPHLERAVSLAPDVPRYRYHLAKAYAALRRYTDARDQYIRVMDFDPGGPWERMARSDLAQLPQMHGQP
jgi:tetratricopeptide (TPR) repeat protein